MERYLEYNKVYKRKSLVESLILKVKYVHSWLNESVAVDEDSALLYWKDETAPRPLY